MAAVCLYVLGTLAVGAVVQLDEPISHILEYTDIAICFVFLADFFVSLFRAPNKLDYFLKWGWIDLASSIPTVDVLRWGRAARVLRIFRVIRGVRATKILATFILARRAESAVLTAALVSILLIVFASLAILQIESGPEANIQTAEDALWWAFVTITTVGYGDKFPVSTEGRFLAIVLMTCGVGLFGTFTAFVATWFLAPGTQARENELAALRAELVEIKHALQRYNATDPAERPPAQDATLPKDS